MFLKQFLVIPALQITNFSYQIELVCNYVTSQTALQLCCVSIHNYPSMWTYSKHYKHSIHLQLTIGMWKEQSIFNGFRIMVYNTVGLQQYELNTIIICEWSWCPEYALQSKPYQTILK